MPAPSDQPFATLADEVLDFFFPTTCALCYEPCPPGTFICPSCLDSIPRIPGTPCQRCGSPISGNVHPGTCCQDCIASPPPFDFALSCGPFTTPVRDFILSLKFHGQIHLARPLALLATRRLQEDPRIAAGAPWLLVPVPVHPWRFIRRRFNQSAEIARFISRLTGWPTFPLLRRTRFTPPQSRLHRKHRLSNLTDAFQTTICPPEFLNLPILVIDDVFTTGSTVKNCVLALRKTTRPTRPIPHWLPVSNHLAAFARTILHLPPLPANPPQASKTIAVLTIARAGIP